MYHTRLYLICQVNGTVTHVDGSVQMFSTLPISVFAVTKISKLIEYLIEVPSYLVTSCSTVEGKITIVLLLSYNPHSCY